MRLNAGCADVQPDGWANVDADPIWNPPVLADLRALPFPDGTFDLIVANHSLQMLDRLGLAEALRELHRVCARGGILRVLVPDLFAAIYAYESNDLAHFHIDPLVAADRDAKLCTYITQGGTTRSVFTRRHLVNLLAAAGWEPAVMDDSRTLSADPRARDLDSRLGESLIVEGRR